MKKQYIKPATDICLVDMQSIIANSLDVNPGETDEQYCKPALDLNIWDFDEDEF